MTTFITGISWADVHPNIVSIESYLLICSRLKRIICKDSHDWKMI